MPSIDSLICMAQQRTRPQQKPQAPSLEYVVQYCDNTDIELLHIKGKHPTMVLNDTSPRPLKVMVGTKLRNARKLQRKRRIPKYKHGLVVLQSDTYLDSDTFFYHIRTELSRNLFGGDPIDNLYNYPQYKEIIDTIRRISPKHRRYAEVPNDK